MSWIPGTTKLRRLTTSKFHHQLNIDIHAMDPGQLTHSQWGSRHSPRYFACTFYFPIVGCKYLGPPNALLDPCQDVPETHVASARLVWTSVNGFSCPPDGNYKTQRAWDRITDMRDFNVVVEQATTDIDKARLLAVQSPHSCDWLYAITISSCGLRQDNEAIRVAVFRRLCLELCQPHSC